MSSLAAGATTTLTLALSAKTCPFHDEVAPTNANFQGQVQTQANTVSSGAPSTAEIGSPARKNRAGVLAAEAKAYRVRRS